MSAERSAFDFNSIIPEMYRSKAEAFARCLQEKLIFLGGYATSQNDPTKRNDAVVIDGESSPKTRTDNVMKLTYAENGYEFCSDESEGMRGWNGEEFEECSTGRSQRSDREDVTLLENYDVPYRVLRESSSTSDLEKHCTEAGGLSATKRLSKSGNSLSGRLNNGINGEEKCLNLTRVPSTKRIEEDTHKTDTKSGITANVPGIKVTSTDNSDADPQVKLRRCSSLKTYKTPPGTPGEKKIVRFADALGLDLADVRTFLDEIPKIPSSAYEDLQCDFAIRPPTNPTLIPNFSQPSADIYFLERVRNEYVCLENAALTDTAVLTVSGCVRVRNLTYEKSVHIRYTKDNWRSFSDLQATYVPNSCDGFSDRFSFVLYAHNLKIGEKLQFAIRLDCCGSHYWDNNRGKNYAFECLPQSPSTSLFTETPLSPTDTWSIFY